MGMDEKQFRKWILEKIEEICEETHQLGYESCPFCCQEEYPVNGDLVGYEEIEAAGLEPDGYHTDHYDDCLVTVLDKYREKIEKDGVWC
jgi:hypothetical protein